MLGFTGNNLGQRHGKTAMNFNTNWGDSMRFSISQLGSFQISSRGLEELLVQS